MRFDSLCHKNGKEGQIRAAGYPAESFLSKFALRIYINWLMKRIFVIQNKIFVNILLSFAGKLWYNKLNMHGKG